MKRQTIEMIHNEGKVIYYKKISTPMHVGAEGKQGRDDVHGWAEAIGYLDSLARKHISPTINPPIFVPRGRAIEGHNGTR